MTDNDEMNKLFLAIKDDCICPGHNMTLECTVVAPPGGSIVWSGTSFNCPNSNNEIDLLYTRLNESSGECNNGSIVAWSSGIDSEDTYTSQLIVEINSWTSIVGQTIACQYDNGTHQSIKLTKNGMFELAFMQCMLFYYCNGGT